MSHNKKKEKTTIEVSEIKKTQNTKKYQSNDVDVNEAIQEGDMQLAESRSQNKSDWVPTIDKDNKSSLDINTLDQEKRESNSARKPIREEKNQILGKPRPGSSASMQTGMQSDIMIKNKEEDSDYLGETQKKILSNSSSRQTEDTDEEIFDVQSDEDSDIDEQIPSKKLAKCYFVLKMLGLIIYLGSMFTMFGLWYTSRFYNLTVKQVFGTFLIARPLIILIYCMIQASLRVHRTIFVRKDKSKILVQDIALKSEIRSFHAKVSYNKSRTKATQAEFNNYLPNCLELISNFFILPLVIYSGFARVSIVFEKKKDFLLASHAQEMFMHAIPLTLVVLYNSQKLDMFEGIQKAAIILSILNVTEVFFEWKLIQIYENLGINIERKSQVTSKSRCRDTIIVAVIGGIFTVAAIITGMYVLNEQKCGRGFFESDVDLTCNSCRIIIDDLCADCNDANQCLECDIGYYVDNDIECKSCKQLFGVNTSGCTASEAVTCVPGFFVSEGICYDCNTISGCLADQCDNRGCSQCEQGYYLENGRCYPCSNSLSGCSECISGTECTQCASKFFKVDQGQCVCDSKLNNAQTDQETGACQCEDNYYLTDRGCNSCKDLISNCFSCTKTQEETKYQLYQTGIKSTEQEYLTCNKCKYSYFSQDEKCKSCDKQWDGCANCDEKKCSKCYNTHVFTGDRKTPCRTCSYYMSNCVTCTDQSDCKECKDGYSKIFGACINTPW